MPICFYRIFHNIYVCAKTGATTGEENGSACTHILCIRYVCVWLNCVLRKLFSTTRAYLSRLRTCSTLWWHIYRGNMEQRNTEECETTNIFVKIWLGLSVFPLILMMNTVGCHFGLWLNQILQHVFITNMLCVAIYFLTYLLFIFHECIKVKPYTKYRLYSISIVLNVFEYGIDRYWQIMPHCLARACACSCAILKPSANNSDMKIYMKTLHHHRSIMHLLRAMSKQHTFQLGRSFSRTHRRSRYRVHCSERRTPVQSVCVVLHTHANDGTNCVWRLSLKG